jgi:DNA gyrase/topoisomerase IV subunit B
MLRSVLPAICRLTSSNYDDDQKKMTGGRNGYGAKLANIYSTEFGASFYEL